MKKKNKANQHEGEEKERKEKKKQTNKQFLMKSEILNQRLETHCMDLLGKGFSVCCSISPIQPYERLQVEV